MSDMSAAIGLASFSAVWPPPNSSACLAGMNDQVTASIMPRTASARLAARVRTCSVVRILRVDRVVAAERLRRDVVDAVDAHHLLDQIGLAVDIRPPGRHRHIDDIARALRLEAEARQDVEAFRLRHLDAGQPLHFRQREGNDLRRVAGIADDLGFASASPPQKSSTSFVASSTPGTMNSGSTPRSKR